MLRDRVEPQRPGGRDACLAAVARRVLADRRAAPRRALA
jgi:hypothetical protein